MSRGKILSKVEQITRITKDAIASKWCQVDIDNVFMFNKMKLKIDDSVKQYQVKEPPVFDTEKQKWNDWKNECEMDKIFVVHTNKGFLFFDQDLEMIELNLILDTK